MHADHGVVSAVRDVQPQRSRAARALYLEYPCAAPFLLVAVAYAEKRRQVPVNKGVTVAYDLSVEARQESQRVLYPALCSGLGSGLSYRLCGGGVSSARAAGENQQLHGTSKVR